MLLSMARLRLTWSPPYGNDNGSVGQHIRGKVIVLAGGYDDTICKVVDVVVAMLKVYYINQMNRIP
jgi:hypothetical protein